MTLISNSCRKNPRFAKIDLMSRYGVLFQSKQGPNIDFQSRRQQLCCRWPLLAWHCCNPRQKPCQLEVIIRPKKAPWKLESGKARDMGEQCAALVYNVALITTCPRLCVWWRECTCTFWPLSFHIILIIYLYTTKNRYLKQTL